MVGALLFGRRYILAVAVLVCMAFPSIGEVSERIIINGSTGVKPLIESLTSTYRQRTQAPQILIGGGSNPQDRIQALIDNDIDIAMASHGIDRTQILHLRLQVHRIAKVAVVIGVNHSVSVDSISAEQLCDIYRGTISRWQHLGGRPHKIVPFVRPAHEVDYEVVHAHIPCFSELNLAANVQMKNKSGQMASAIASTPGAIGMTTLVRVLQSQGNVIALALNDVVPSPANLLSGSYPLSRDIYLITDAQPSPAVSAFLAFIRSNIGAEIILANHGIPAR